MRKRKYRSSGLHSRRYALALAAGGVGLSGSVFAASSTWTFTSGPTSWTNPAAWLGGSVPGLVGGAGSLNDNAFFTTNLNTANGQPFNFPIQLGAPITLASLSMSDTNTQTPNGWTITDTGGGSITFDSGGTSPVVTIGPLGTDTFHSDSQTYVGMYTALYGTSGLTKAGGSLLRLGNDNSNLSGTLNVNAGTIEIAAPTAANNLAPLGNVATQINMGGGVLSLRSDSTMHLDGYTLNLTGNSGVNVDNTVNSTGTSSGNAGGVHTIGSIIFSGAANRTLTVTGSHGAALHIGTMTTSSDNLGAVINNLSPGSLTIASFVSNATAASTVSFGGSGTTSFGGDITVSNSISQGGGALSVAYNDLHSLNVGSFNGLTGGLFINGSALRSATSANAGGGSLTVYAAGGTVNVLAGGIPSGSLTVRVGTLNILQPLTSTLSATTTQLTMGGGTVSSGPSAATINLNGGTLLINSATANIAVNTGTLANNNNFPLASTTAAVQTLAVLSGNLDLGSAPTTIRVGTTTLGTIPSTTLDLFGTVYSSNTITKTGVGRLVLYSANALSGPIILQGGELMALAHTSGNALSTGPMTIMSGSLRIAQEFAGAVSSNSATTLAFAGDSLDPARIISDAASTGTVTLNIGTFLGRVPGTTGVLTILPQIGALNTQEVIHIGMFDPSVDPASPGFRNMLPAYIVAQQDGGNTAMDFLTKDGGSNLTVATYSASTDIATAGSDAIFQATGSTSNSVPTGVTATIFALKSQGQIVFGQGTLVVGDGAHTGGIILNDGQISVIHLTLNAPETVVWAGGSNAGLIPSGIRLLGDLTSAGAQTLNIAGTLDMTGSSRKINVDGPAYMVLSGTLTNGNLIKGGPGTLTIANANAGYAGTLTVNSGTAEINSSGNLASGTVILGSNGYLEFNKSAPAFSFARPIQGAGTVVQNSPGGTLQLTAGNALSNFTNLNIAQGRVLLSVANELPPAVVLTNSGTSAVFDLNGKNQTIGGLNGIGSVVSTGPSATGVLTVNGGGSFGGALRDGTAGQLLKLVKTGASSTLSLSQISTFSGGVDVSAGTLLVIGDNTSANNSLNHLGQSTVTLNGGALSMAGSQLVNLANNVTIPAGQTGTMAFDINNDSTQGFSMFGGGTIRFNSLGSSNTVAFTGNWGAFTGTLNFDQANGTIHINTQSASNFGSDKAFFDFGAGSFILNIEGNAIPGMNLGALSGGINTKIYAQARGQNNAAFEQYQVGSYNNGNISTTFQGEFDDTPNSAYFTGLQKVGSGSLTLTGTSNFTGPLTITQGVVTIGGDGVLSGASAMILDAGTFAFANNGAIAGIGRTVRVNNGVFDVTGAGGGGFSLPAGVTILGTSLVNQTGYIRGNFTEAAGGISPGNASTAGTVTFGASSAQVTVNMTGGNNVVDILTPGSVGAGFNDLIKINGVLNMSTGAAFRINSLNDNFVPGIGDEFPVLVYTDSRTGMLTPNVTSPFHGQYSLIDHPGAANLGGTIGIKVLTIIDSAPANLTWTGAFSNDWDLNITSNFVTAGAPNTFFQFDNVTMDDTAATGTVNLPAITIKPTTLTFNNSTKDYFIVGAGRIGGSATLIKNGNGNLTIKTANNFTGGGTINGGTLIVGDEPATLSPLEALGGVNNGTGNGSTIAINNATISLSNVSTSNNWLIPTGSSATFLFRSIPPLVGSGSGVFSGNLIGGGTVNLINGTNIGSMNVQSADNSQATGFINLWPNPTLGGNGSITVTIQRSGGAGNAVWSLPDTLTPRATVRTGVADAWVSEMPMGGLQGNGTLQGFNGGSVATKIRFAIGGRNIDTTWAGAIIDNNGTMNGGPTGGNFNASSTVLVKAGSGTLVLTGTALNYRGETVVNNGVLVLDGIASQSGGGTLGGNLQNSPLIQVNGGTLLLRNGVQISRANATASIGDVTMGQYWSAITGGHIDLAQALDYLSTGSGSPDRFQLPPGLTLSGNGGTYHGPVQLGYLGGGTLAAGAPANATGAGTINAGDSGVAPIGQQPAYGGLGKYGTVTFDELHIGTGGTVTFDVSQAGVAGGTGNDLIATNGDLEVAGGTLAVNFNGGAVAGTTYRLFNAGNLLNSATFTTKVLNARVAGGGPMTAANVNATTGAGGTVELVVTQSSVSNAIGWQPRNTSQFNPAASFYVANTWDTNFSNNWKNNTIGALTADFFYPTDTVTFDTTIQIVTAGGTATLVDGTVVLAAPVFPAAVVVNAQAGAGYTFAGTTFIGRIAPSAGKISGTASLTKNGTGSLVLTTDNDYTGPTLINAGVVQVGTNPINGSGSGDPSATVRPLLNENLYGTLGSGPVTIASGATLSFSRINNYVVPNTILGAGSLVKTNLSQIRLDGSNSYTGGTFIRSGTIRMGNANAIPGGSTVTLVTTPFAILTTSNVGGALNLYGYNLTLNNLLSADAAGVVGAGQSGAVQNNGNTVLTVAPTLTITTANFAGAIQNNVNLVKVGASSVATMSYSGASYTGKTFINAGTLQVIVGNGSNATHNSNSNGTYFIASGAALAGNGTINAPITVQNGGILAPGVFGAATLASQVGTLSLGTVSLDTGVINLDLNGGLIDQVNIRNTNGLDTTGFSALAGQTSININNLTAGGFVTAGTYTVINYAGIPLAQSTIDTYFHLGSAFPNYTMALLSNTANTSIDLSIIHTGAAVEGVWNSNANGSWTIPANWLSDPASNVPNSIDGIATFGPVITAARTITMDASRTLGTMVFNNANSYTISGTSGQVLTFDRSANVTGINVKAGSHTIDAPVVSLDDVVINTDPGASLRLKQTFTVSDINTSTGHALTKTGGGTLQVEHVRNTFGNDGAATLSVNGGRLIVSQKLAANNDPSGTSVVNALSIAGGAVLDLTNNSMVIDYNTGAGPGSLLSDLKTMLNDGRLVTTAPSPVGGADVRLGYKDNANSTGAGNGTVASFAGQTVDSSSVLIKFTYGGDTNLDGKVDISDLLNLAQHYNGAGDWQFGDFTRDGLVNSADLAILAQDWQAGTSSGQLGGSLSGLLGGLGLPGDVGVPEPTTLGLTAMGLGSLMLSRRRRRNA